MALAIFFPDSQHLLVVKGRKYEDMIISYARSYARELPASINKALKVYSAIWTKKNMPERVQFFRSRETYCIIRDWVKSEGEKRADVPNAKRDKLALVGGEILDNEFTDYHDEYGEYACVREVVEESGLIIVDETSKSNLFYQIDQYWEQDRESPKGTITYQNLVYWVTEARSQTRDKNGFPSPRDRGVQGETFASFYLEIERINSDNFHRKHGYIVREALRKKVSEAGGEKYIPALKHLEEEFPGEIPYSLHLEKQIDIIEPVASRNLTDSEEFAKAMAGVSPLR